MSSDPEWEWFKSFGLLLLFLFGLAVVVGIIALTFIAAGPVAGFLAIIAIVIAIGVFAR